MKSRRDKFQISNFRFQIALAMVISGLIWTGGCGKTAPATKVHTLKIGMQDEPKTFNPFKASDVWSWNVMEEFLYEPLYNEAPQTFEIIPWLAEGDPEYDETTNTCIVRLKKGVRWHDGVPFTARDVVFTAQVMKEFKVPQYFSEWEFVEEVEALDDYTVRYTLRESYVIFFTRTLLLFIAPEHIWKPVIDEVKKSEAPLTKLLEYEVKKTVGLGHFRFKEWEKGAYIKLVRNPDYFAAGREVKGQRIGPYFDEVIFKIYGTTDAAILALKRGDIDFIWWPVQPGFVDELEKDPRITVTENPENGLKYVAFNLRREPFKDVKFRQAAAYLVDKDFLVKRVLQGYGLRNDSLVPPGNEFWYNPDTAKFGQGMTRPERVRKAVEILKNAGYSWEKEPEVKADGETLPGSGLIMPSGEKVPAFQLLTPPADYDPLRAMSGTFIQEWWREVGIPVTAAPTSFGDIVNKVHTEWNFAAYLLGWILTTDPNYMRSLLHSREIVRDGNNSIAYSNPEYDRLADASARELNRDKRRELIMELQDIVIQEVAYIPLFTVKRIEAYRNDRFVGWVNQLGGIGDYWSFAFLKPVDENPQ